jgi:membrane protein
MKDWLIRFKGKPWVAHIVRALGRYNERLGSQFGAAITYFSVLALVPILMLAFSVTGFVLTVVRPDLIQPVVAVFADALGGTGATRARITDLVQNWLSNYAAVGIIGLLTAAYSGAAWVNNLKNAVRAQWRTDFDDVEPQPNLVVRTMSNLAILAGLLVAVVVTFGLAAVSTSLTESVLGWVGLGEIGWLQPVLRFVPIVFSIAAGWLLFMYLYTVLPAHRMPWWAVRRGALIGAVGLAVLQYLASFLIGTFASNPTAALFGPVITLMLFFNLFAQLILFVAAWIASYVTRDEGPADELAHRMRTAVAQATGGDPATGGTSGTGSTSPVLVPQSVAARSVQIGLGAGYVTGAATGVGAGAVLTWLIARLARRHGRHHGE